jgi:hypothetical protein
MNDLELSGHKVTEVFSRHSSGETEEKSGKNFRQDNRCPRQDSSPTSVKNKSRALLLNQRART